jgi:anti-sigma factor RsiW
VQLLGRCAGVARFVDTYLDGEFGELERGEVEAHLGECERCRMRVRSQSEWRQAIRRSAPREIAPEALRARLQLGLRQAERQAESEERGLLPLLRRHRRRAVLALLPVAAAAGVLLVLGSARMHAQQVARDVIAKHRRNLPIEVAGEADQLRRWYADKVDFPVRPPRLEGAALRGGRIANVSDRQAAYLVYDANGNKVSVFIFDPGDLPLDAAHKTTIHNQEVYLDEERGYNVAFYRDRGVGYAIASDLDSASMLKLVSAAVDPR